MALAPLNRAPLSVVRGIATLFVPFAIDGIAAVGNSGFGFLHFKVITEYEVFRLSQPVGSQDSYVF